jgi:hypothetical protein
VTKTTQKPIEKEIGAIKILAGWLGNENRIGLVGIKYAKLRQPEKPITSSSR